ncbi:hypothetical protein MTsPCn7_06660 [Altererythrobacter sp. MTPC7]
MRRWLSACLVAAVIVWSAVWVAPKLVVFGLRIVSNAELSRAISETESTNVSSFLHILVNNVTVEECRTFKKAGCVAGSALHEFPFTIHTLNTPINDGTRRSERGSLVSNGDFSARDDTPVTFYRRVKLVRQIVEFIEHHNPMRLAHNLRGSATNISIPVFNRRYVPSFIFFSRRFPYLNNQVGALRGLGQFVLTHHGFGGIPSILHGLSGKFNLPSQKERADPSDDKCEQRGDCHRYGSIRHRLLGDDVPRIVGVVLLPFGLLLTLYGFIWAGRLFDRRRDAASLVSAGIIVPCGALIAAVGIIALFG